MCYEVFHIFYFTFMLPCVVTDFLLITNQTHYLSKFILS